MGSIRVQETRAEYIVRYSQEWGGAVYMIGIESSIFTRTKVRKIECAVNMNDNQKKNWI